MSKTVTCKICYLQDHTDNQDMDSDIHKGFTIGNGKQLYWYMIWHSSGHVTVFSTNEKTRGGRWISGDSMITIHWR